MHQDRVGLTGRVVAQLEGPWGLWLNMSQQCSLIAHELNYVLALLQELRGSHYPLCLALMRLHL